MERRALAWLLLAALAARLPLWLGAHGAEFDIESYRRVARVMAEGGRLYGDAALQGRYPYGPAWALLLWPLAGLARLGGLPDTLLFKLPSVAADLGICVLIHQIASRLAPPLPPRAGRPLALQSRAFWAAFAWAVHPVALMVGAGHGQFDSVALFFILLAAWYLEFSEHPQSDFAGALSLGFAVAFKTWPVFFLPLFLRCLSSPPERRRFAALCLGLPLALILPFALSCHPADMARALAYTGSQAFSLPEALRGFFFGAQASPQSYQAVASAWRAVGASALLLLWLSAMAGIWRFPLFPGLALATLTLYVFAPGLAAQYLLWLLPFSLLLPGRLALRYGLIAMAALAAFYALFAPEALLRPGIWEPPALPGAFYLAWAVLNLGFWLYLAREWAAMARLCRRPGGRLGLA